MSQRCKHDPDGALPGTCYPCKREAENDAYEQMVIETSVWLDEKAGHTGRDIEDDLLVLSEMFALQDERDQL